MATAATAMATAIHRMESITGIKVDLAMMQVEVFDLKSWPVP